MDNRVPENLLNIWQNHKLHRNCYGKLEGGIDSGRPNPNGGKNPKKHLPKKLVFNITILYSDNASGLFTYEVNVGSNKFTKSKEMINQRK